MSQCIVSVTEDMFVRKFEPNEPYYAAHWMLTKLVPEHVGDLRFEVYIRRMKHQRGMCWAYHRYPLDYTIVIDSQLGRMDSLRAIAHESYHVAQFASGRMKDLWDRQNRGKVLWGNQMLQVADRGSAYWNSPWEKEAYDGQDRLAKAYVRHVKKLVDKSFG